MLTKVQTVKMPKTLKTKNSIVRTKTMTSIVNSGNVISKSKGYCLRNKIDSHVATPIKRTKAINDVLQESKKLKTGIRSRTRKASKLQRKQSLLRTKSMEAIMASNDISKQLKKQGKHY